MNDNLKNYLWTGQSLEIVTANMEKYFSEIVNHDLALTIKRPLNRKNIPLTMENGMSVKVYFYDDHRELYTFDSTIYQLKNYTCLLEKPLPESIQKAQRRRFFRVQVAVPLNLRVLREDLYRSRVWYLTTYDISGGGISFLTEEKIFSEGELLEGSLFLRSKDLPFEVKFKGIIVYIQQLGYRMYKTAVEFVDMKESERSTIIRYCMTKQIELRNTLNRK